MLENKPIVEESVKEKGLVVLRISEIVDRLIEEDEIFEEINRTEMVEFLSTLIEKSPQELISIDDNELRRRIEKVMSIQAMSGMLDDLSPAQKEHFKAAVKRRDFFR